MRKGKNHSKQKEWGIQKLSGIRKAQDFLGPAEFVVLEFYSSLLRKAVGEVRVWIRH